MGPENPDMTKKRILVVDDEADVLTFLTTLFEDNGYETIRASDGVEALQRARAERPDMITLDMTMPEQSGVRVIRELKADAELRRIPVIVVTGIGESMNTFMKKIASFPRPEGFVAKPIDTQELLQQVKRLLG